MAKDVMDLHAKVTLLLDRQGAAATAKALRDGEKAVAELGSSFDSTAKKIERFEELQKQGVITQKELIRLRKREAGKAIISRLPGGAGGGMIGDVGAALGFGGTAGAAAGAGVALWTVQAGMQLKLANDWLRKIEENTRSAEEIGADPEKLRRLFLGIRATGRVGNPQEVANAVAAFGTKHLRERDPQKAMERVQSMIAGMDDLAARDVLSELGIPGSAAELRNIKIPDIAPAGDVAGGVYSRRFLQTAAARASEKAGARLTDDVAGTLQGDAGSTISLGANLNAPAFLWRVWSDISSSTQETAQHMSNSRNDSITGP